ncbi:DNA topoisomerase [Methanosalsum zhilinae DSM 4017]|uniref:DNA topoisomerase n=1 Tax=Methanosalsum zhilinae (strain DSM 4017 / NBRC 107636 / OCM 62 / WeN5) TaxID=679901 RepID=F7XQ31_METZD|nr:DNA topoisomerase [Methanosalsum zhilinae]AEH60392.1 DNA topoisomerase [Methanosalsum zhilinae DSM 4017]
MTTVVITEKNRAAEQIARILSNGKYKRIRIESIPVYEFSSGNQSWKIMGLAGHIMGYDYPSAYKDWRAVDPGTLLDIEPEKKVLKEEYASVIRKLANEASEIILACDYDREGENIGFEAKDIASKVSDVSFKRAKFSSLSPEEINRAFNSLVEPDVNMAMAAEARQILDLKMGVAFTRFITLSVREYVRTKKILSVGPCQSPTCGFVYERERTIRDFKPTDFWKIEALFNSGETNFPGSHRKGKIFNKDEAMSVYRKIKDCSSGSICERNVKESSVNPPNPLNTNELLKRGSNFLGISPENTLKIAEDLYLAGFISYPRTETNKYSKEFKFAEIIDEFRNGHYNDCVSLLPGDIHPKNGKKDSHDHPPIYPIKSASKKDVMKLSENPDYWNIYDLIVRHFFANLMPPAIFEKTHLAVLVKDEIFDSKGSVMKDAGWMQVYPFEKSSDKLLPRLQMGDGVNIEEISCNMSQTTPPKKLTEAELLTLMEHNGIGTKATASGHIETNKKRGYFENRGKTVSIMDRGFVLMDALNESVPSVIKPEVRARIESLIQDVESGNMDIDSAVLEGTDLIKKMYSCLSEGKDRLASKVVAAISDEAAQEDKKNFIGYCSQCNRILKIIKTDNGRFVGCTGYPQCKNTYPLPRKGALSILRSSECRRGGAAVIKVGKKYHWAVGIGPCFTCEFEKECFPPEIIGDCPECDGSMFVIQTEKSRFLGCTKRCGYTQSLPDKGRLTINEDKCENCGWNILRVKEMKKDALVICINRKCKKRYNKC